MRMKVSNYIAGQLVAHGISQVFTVTGGGAMHLNDALGHQVDCIACTSIMNRPVPWRRKAMRESTIKSVFCA